MSQLINKVEEMIEKVRAATGLNLSLSLPVLQKLGEVQAALDSLTNGSIDPAKFQWIKAQIAAIKLDDGTVSKALAAIDQLKAMGLPVSLDEQTVSKLVADLRLVQAQIAALELDAAQIAEIMSKLQQMFSQVESMLLAQLNSLKLSDGEVLRYLQKLK